MKEFKSNLKELRSVASPPHSSLMDRLVSYVALALVYVGVLPFYPGVLVISRIVEIKEARKAKKDARYKLSALALYWYLKQFHDRGYNLVGMSLTMSDDRDKSGSMDLNKWFRSDESEGMEEDVIQYRINSLINGDHLCRRADVVYIMSPYLDSYRDILFVRRTKRDMFLTMLAEET